MKKNIVTKLSLVRCCVVNFNDDVGHLYFQGGGNMLGCT
jgi:hypothetical protein